MIHSPDNFSLFPEGTTFTPNSVRELACIMQERRILLVEWYERWTERLCWIKQCHKVDNKYYSDSKDVKNISYKDLSYNEINAQDHSTLIKNGFVSSISNYEGLYTVAKLWIFSMLNFLM